MSTTKSMSDWEAGVSLAKAIMGAGSFALPWAFSKMGYLGGPIFLVFFLLLSVHSIGLLVDCACALRNHQPKTNGTLSYVDVARSTLGPSGAILAYTASVSASIGVCGSYLIFVSVNLRSLLLSLLGISIGVTPLIWTVALPISVLLSSVEDAKRFAKVALWGDVSVVAGMLAVLVYGIAAPPRTTNQDGCVAFGSVENMALAFGSIGYLFLVHFLVLPIESSMAMAAAEEGSLAMIASDDHKTRFQRVVLRTFAICGGIGGFFGIVGYLLFGSNTQEIVLLNLEGGIGMSVVQFLLCIDLFLTYPVVMRPSINLLEEHWIHHQGTKSSPKCDNATIRTDDEEGRISLLPNQGHSKRPTPTDCVKRSAPNSWNREESLETSTTRSVTTRSVDAVYSLKVDGTATSPMIAAAVTNHKSHISVCWVLGLVAASAASFVPAFGLLTGLVGGVSQTFLAFVLPPIMWTKVHHNNQRPGTKHIPKDHKDNGSVFSLVAWRESILVLCGLGLILWTLHSTLRAL